MGRKEIKYLFWIVRNEVVDFDIHNHPSHVNTHEDDFNTYKKPSAFSI